MRSGVEGVRCGESRALGEGTLVGEGEGAFRADCGVGASREGLVAYAYAEL